MGAETGPVPSKRERTRCAILDAAITVIAEKGLESSSIDDLMATAGMARGTFYNYFHCREEVLHAVVDMLREIITREIISRLPGGLTPEEIIACATCGYLRFCLDHPRIGTVLAKIGGFSLWEQNEDDTHPGAERIRTAIVKLSEEPTSPTSVRIYLEGLANTLLWRTLAGQLDLERAEEIIALELRGLGVGSARISHSLDTARRFAATIRAETAGNT